MSDRERDYTRGTAVPSTRMAGIAPSTGQGQPPTAPPIPAILEQAQTVTAMAVDISNRVESVVQILTPYDSNVEKTECFGSDMRGCLALIEISLRKIKENIECL